MTAMATAALAELHANFDTAAEQRRAKLTPAPVAAGPEAEAIWRRQMSLLDSGVDTLTVIGRADATGLAVLEAELGDYLLAKLQGDERAAGDQLAMASDAIRQRRATC